jgi:tetratricopeptide (TPR) repeat protein
VTGWFATHPAEALNGACVSDRYAHPVPTQLDKEWKLSPGTIYPSRLQDSLGRLRVRPEEIPGEVLAMFVRDAVNINQDHDKRLHQLAINLSEAFTVHAATTWLLEHEPWDFATVYLHGIDLVCHDFMPFHPPRRHGVYENEFHRYSDVVNSIYRLHDAMLGRLLQLAGDDVTVMIVSDHGFKNDETRPMLLPNIPTAIAAWHRANGIFAVCGPGLRRDELIHGASLLDITPTILSLFGLPVGADMDGRVLTEIFEETPTVERIESWETTGVDRPAPEVEAVRSPDEENELIRQFVEIGYIEDPGNNAQQAMRNTRRENHWSLAQSYLAAGRHADALPLLEEVYEEWPERWDFACELALTQLTIGLVDEARETMSELRNRKSAGAYLLRANLEYRSRHFEKGLKLLEQAEALDPSSAPLQNQLGLTRLRLRDAIRAEVAFRKAIEIDEDDAQAHLGVAFCRLRARAYEEAADFALRALGLRFDLALGHHYLGVALARLGQDKQAIEAFETCLRYQPGWNPAHRYLIVLRKRQPGAAEEVGRHREFLRGRVKRRKAYRAFRHNMRREARERARLRASARQEQRSKERMALFDAPVSHTAEAFEFLIVSGLPRSGTSLMMQILHAAGVPIMTDQKRASDESNPRGYFEWEEIKQLTKNPFVIEKAEGRAVKVVSMLLPSLPKKHRYRVIFMQRPIADVAGSQASLRERLAGTSAADPRQMQKSLCEHRDRMLQMLQDVPNVDLLEVEYDELLENPRPHLERVAEFARIDRQRVTMMESVIDHSLRHFRVGPVDQVAAKS